MKSVTFGIKTAPQHTTYEAMLRVWQQADDNPAFDHAWLFDHYAPIHSDVTGPCLEGWTTLAAFAAENLLEEYCVTIAPSLVGGSVGGVQPKRPLQGPALPTGATLRLLTSVTEDGFLFQHYAVQRP